MDEFLVKAFSQSIHGDFICPDLREILNDVDSETAGKQVEGLPTTIYQITKHLINWGTWGLNGAGGDPFIRTSAQEELNFFPSMESPSQEEWENTKAELNNFVESFEARLIAIDQTGIHRDWKSFNNTRALLFVVVHAAYHTAQIVAILRLLGGYHRS